jgi:hypothetical protein
MSVSIITVKDAKPLLKETGSLSFPSKYWDCAFYCKLDELKTLYNIKGEIKNVLIMTNLHDDFKNIKNTNINYRVPLNCDSDADGALPSRKYVGRYVMNNPLGDVIIVATKKN